MKKTEKVTSKDSTKSSVEKTNSNVEKSSINNRKDTVKNNSANTNQEHNTHSVRTGDFKTFGYSDEYWSQD